jgi:hypothetical protein
VPARCAGCSAVLTAASWGSYDLSLLAVMKFDKAYQNSSMKSQNERGCNMEQMSSTVLKAIVKAGYFPQGLVPGTVSYQRLT